MNLESLSRLKVSEITPEVLAEKGLIRNRFEPVKILGQGTLSAGVNIKAHAFSKKAAELIKNAGGNIETHPRQPQSRYPPVHVSLNIPDHANDTRIHSYRSSPIIRWYSFLTAQRSPDIQGLPVFTISETRLQDCVLMPSGKGGGNRRQNPLENCASRAGLLR